VWDSRGAARNVIIEKPRHFSFDMLTAAFLWRSDTISSRMDVFSLRQRLLNAASKTRRVSSTFKTALLARG
jgi:hypothetical protein